MNDIDTRLRDTFDRVAETTRVTDRVEEVAEPRRRHVAGLIVATASFVVVILVLGIPLLLNRSQGGTSPATPATPSVSTAIPRMAVDPAWLTVDEDDLGVFAELTEAAAESHGPGWRQPLRTEAVWCLHIGGPGADTRASTFPIAEDLTLDVLQVVCATGNDSARNLESPPATSTVCRGVFTGSAYQEWVASGVTIGSGTIDGSLPGFPVVLGWESDCISEQLDTTTAVMLYDDLSLDEINRARHVEIAVTGASHDICFSYDQAGLVADEARRVLGDHWLRAELTAVQRDLDGSCYQPVIDLQWGAVYVMGVDRPVSEETGSSPTTVPPTSVPPG